MPAAKISKPSLKNTLSAIAEAGLTVSAMTVQPDGSVRFEFADEEQLTQKRPAKDQRGRPMTYEEANS